MGPYPGDTTFNLTTPVKNIKYIVLNSWGGYPTEMELYGHYNPPAAIAPLVKSASSLTQYFGVNAYEWNFEDPTNPLVIDPSYITAIKSFTQFRHYMDWNKLESTQGAYTYDPVHSGGWNYDTMYQACKANNIMVLADLKEQPDWLVASYPAGLGDADNVPVPYGSSFSDPNSYLLQARVAFQYAARYGYNTAVPVSLVTVDTTIRWTSDPENIIKIGMGLIKYIECDNERDKWWKGRSAYQTSYEYAANMSAFYDGNKNTMGAGVGIKNADTTMLVVMGGLASADPSYVHGMIEWCRQHRGYKADGSINLCWDVINYHLYANNYTASVGYATVGVAPEVAASATTAQRFIEMAHEYAGDMPVWVTESGYDLNTGSPQRAPAIGDKSAEMVQADWTLRTALLYARAGIKKLFYYEEYDDNAANPTQYASCGLVNDDQTRRPAADYIYQANKVFGTYTYKQTINSNPFVDRYQLSDTQKMYVLAMPTQTGDSSTYALHIGTADSAYIYKPTAGSDDMSVTKVKVTDSLLTLNVTETPIFVMPKGSIATTTYTSIPFATTINTYPDPATDVLHIDGVSASVTYIIYDATGRQITTGTLRQGNNTIKISTLAQGMYILSLQGNGTTSKQKVVKQ